MLSKIQARITDYLPMKIEDLASLFSFTLYLIKLSAIVDVIHEKVIDNFGLENSTNQVHLLMIIILIYTFDMFRCSL